MKQSLVVFLAALAACNGTSQSKYDQQQTQVAITPKGSIVGRVTELGTSSPLGGVSVTLNAPTPVTVTTTDQGLFQFNDVVVSSSFVLILDKGGYLRSTASTQVPGSVNYAGATPLAGGVATVDVSLAKADGSIGGFLFLPNGRPAVNATVVVDQRRSYLTAVGSYGNWESVVTAKTGMDGSFTLTGLAEAPAGVTHRVVAQWFDANGDMQADYGGVATSVDVLGASVARIFMRYDDIGQTVIDSNIFDGDLLATDPITFTFALPVLTSGQNGSIVNQFTLVDQTVGTQVAVEQTWENPTKVSLKPVGGNLREGDIYQVAINLKQVNGGSGLPVSSFNFQVRASTVTQPTTQVTNFTVTNPGRTPATSFDWADNAFLLSFNTVPGTSTYYIYARDTTSNPAFVFVRAYNISLGTGRTTITVGLPFNQGRPLQEGNKVTFAVVPVDRYGNTAPLGMAPAATVSDNIQPRATSSVPSRVGAAEPDGINDTAAAATIVLRLNYNEPMDATLAPVYTNSGGAVTQSFVWEAGSTSGLLTLTIPAGGDITGPFTIRGGKDVAGNVLAAADFTGTLGGHKELLVNGSFEDAAGACSLTGWNATGTPAPTSVPNNNSSTTGKCGALIGSAIGATPVTGLTKISQDVVLPDITNGLGWSYQFRYDYRTEYATTGMPAAVTQRCRITDTSDAVPVGFPTLFTYSSANTGGFVNNSLVGGLPPAQTIRFQCEVNNATTNSANAAIFLDNVSVVLVKPGTL